MRLALLLLGWLGPQEAPAPAPQDPAPVAEEQHGEPQGEPQEGERVKLDLRVASVRPGGAVVDRGTSDGIAVGDRVVLRPREGGAQPGTVVEVGERSAVVELADPEYQPVPGTRGEVEVLRSRLAPPAPAEPGAVPPVLPEHPPWQNQDEGWSQERPLLSQAEAVRPADREARVFGRWYTVADQIWSTEDDRTDTILRAGGGAEYTNPFGKGGVLQLDAEANYRSTDVPDDDDESKVRLRLDRLSYAHGGTRFDEQRVEVGRFLHHEVPELGVLDGFEWSHRAGQRNRFGASFGFLPEPDTEQETGQDLEVSVFYRCFSDETERLSAAFAYQKTFHDLTADRDLVVAQFLYLPPEGWRVDATAWIDLYTSGDDLKDSPVGLTQAIVHAGRHNPDGSSLDLTYQHLEFPEIDRTAFTPVLAAQIADDRNDRLGLRGRERVASHMLVEGRVGVWDDEEGQGGDAQLGFVFEDLLVDEGQIELAAFATEGATSNLVGVRGALSRYRGDGGWRVDYEFVQNKFDGFSSANNELPMHRLRASLDRYWLSGWSLSAHVEGQLWDQEYAVNVGFYLQRTF